MTDSYRIMLSVNEWLKTIEMKKFVDGGVFLQMKFSFIICQKKNTSTTRTTLRKRSDFKQALSTLER